MAKTPKRPSKKPGRKRTSLPTVAGKRRTDRPTIYTLELGKEICDLVAERVPVVEICALEGMPSKNTLYRWQREIPEFYDQYAHARARRATARGDYIDEITLKMLAGKIDPSAARVAIDAEKWQMSKEQPKIYGDKVTTELTGRDGGPIETRDLDPDRKLNIARKLGLLLLQLEGAPQG